LTSVQSSLNFLLIIIMSRLCPTVKDYESLGVIGEGATAIVYAAHSKITKQKYAIKCIRFQYSLNTKKTGNQVFQNEVDILKSLDHPNVAVLKDYFTGPQHHYLVIEFAEGGDLMDDLQKRGRYSEEHARPFVTEIMQAVRYCHDKNIVHRDLKPENILIDKFGSAKLVDFGLSKKIEKPDSLTTRCGTLLYMAPEISDNDSHGKAVDIWSSGIIIFILLSGYHPFQHERKDESRKLIKKGRLYLHPSRWDGVSLEAITLVHEMICVCPKHRITASESLKSPWLGYTEEFFAGKIKSLYPIDKFPGKVGAEMKMLRSIT